MKLSSPLLREEIVRTFLFLLLVGTVALAGGCGAGGGSKSSAVVTLLPRAGALTAGQSVNISAVVSDLSVVNWSVSGGGALSNVTENSVTYTAPLSVTGNTNTIVTAKTNSASTYTAFTVMPPETLFANVQPVAVDGGPVAAQVSPNTAFTSVTVCMPGTVTCNTIDGILVDTGSVGLRILSSALPPLPGVKDSHGNGLNECVQFVDQSFVWGQVVSADVKIAGEVAESIPIQSISDPAGGTIPSACSSNGSGKNEDTQQALGANGILGIGLDPQDCGSACDPSTRGTPPEPAYYACASSSCSAAFVSLAQQITNPVVLFATDNNGWSMQLAPLTGTTSSVTGSLIFGIGTQQNNALVNATIFTLNSHNHFTVNLPSTDQTLTESFIDSGLNGFFFPDDSVSACTGSHAEFFCPASSVSLSAVNIAPNNVQSAISFNVDNADQLFSSDPTNAAFSTLAGPNGSGTCSSGTGACTFAWGLPFFYGRSVTGSIKGQPFPVVVGVPLLPDAPWWAYTVGFSGH